MPAGATCLAARLPESQTHLLQIKYYSKFQQSLGGQSNCIALLIAKVRQLPLAWMSKSQNHFYQNSRQHSSSLRIFCKFCEIAKSAAVCPGNFQTSQPNLGSVRFLRHDVERGRNLSCHFKTNTAKSSSVQMFKNCRWNSFLQMATLCPAETHLCKMAAETFEILKVLLLNKSVPLYISSY